jgi:hypothetical protein
VDHLTASTVRVQVDAEHKATQFIILDNSNPHSRAFHVSWWGFFSSFFSMFAGAASAPLPHACASLPAAE